MVIFYSKELLTHRPPTLVGYPRLLIQCVCSYPSYLEAVPPSPA